MKKGLSTLYQAISAAFCVIVVLSNILSAKMIQLPFFHFSIPAGLIVYPLTFLLSGLITEIFGQNRAKRTVYIALALSLFSYFLIHITLLMPTQDKTQQKALEAVLGLSSLRIFSSLIAYVASQIIDIQTYALLKRKTSLWFRSSGSNWLSQLVDTFVIDILFLYCGLHMPLTEVFPIMLFSYAYKAFFSFACTPLFCLTVSWIRTKKFPLPKFAKQQS